ncbi:MAG: hypothetical protein IKF38_05015 [Clostridia bacterium]|nr:hypothetical protein [Clostridia bacterium]
MEEKNGEIKKIKEKREEIVKFLKDEKITCFEWELFIKKFIEQKYKESTL